jgi:hypothetical protein
MANRPIQSLCYGRLSFSIFEKETDGNKYKSFSLQKRSFSGETNKYETMGSISLDRFIDLSLVKRMILIVMQSKNDKSEYRPYLITKTNYSDFKIEKFYKEKNSSIEKSQTMILTIREMFALMDLIDRILNFNLKPYENSGGGNKETMLENMRSEEDTMDRDIPFDDDIPF